MLLQDTPRCLPRPPRRLKSPQTGLRRHPDGLGRHPAVSGDTPGSLRRHQKASPDTDGGRRQRREMSREPRELSPESPGPAPLRRAVVSVAAWAAWVASAGLWRTTRRAWRPWLGSPDRRRSVAGRRSARGSRPGCSPGRDSPNAAIGWCPCLSAAASRRLPGGVRSRRS